MASLTTLTDNDFLGSRTTESEPLPETLGEEEAGLTESTGYSHFQYESAVLRQLLYLERLFREHYDRMKQEFCKTKEVVDRLWVLSQRYSLLLSTGTCCTFPEIYAAPAEEVLITEFHSKYCVLRKSHDLMMKSLENLRDECRVFEDLCSHLNFNYETDLILGDSFHKPIKFFMELVSDLFKYLHCWVLKLKLCLSQMSPDDFLQIEEYRRLTEINLDFDEYLLKGLVYCKCLQPRPVCVTTKRILMSKGVIECSSSTKASK